MNGCETLRSAKIMKYSEVTYTNPPDKEVDGATERVEEAAPPCLAIMRARRTHQISGLSIRNAAA
jgi:hypothetical protein